MPSILCGCWFVSWLLHFGSSYVPIALEKQWNIDPVLGACIHMEDLKKKLLALDFGWAQPWLL